MRVIIPGHVYALDSVDTSPGRNPRQSVSFVLRRGPEGEPLSEASRAPGILCQELLRVLIDRVLYLYAERPCDEDTQIIQKLRECLVLFEARAARSAIERLSKPEEAATCNSCGHIICTHPRGERTVVDVKP